MQVPKSTTPSGSSPGAPAVDGQLVSALRNASATTGTRFDVLLASAKLESGLNNRAQAATSSAKGLFQFVEQTWLATMRAHGATHGLASEAAAVVQRGSQLTVDDPALKQRILAMRTDPTVSATLAGDSLRDVSNHLAQAIGRAPTASETYLGHFLGAGGASQMLHADPARTAASVLPEAGRANPAMFNAADGSPFTVSQFLDHVQTKVATAYASLGLTMPAGALNFGAGTAVATTGDGTKADDPTSGASEWGSNTPRRVASQAEKLMLSSLTQVVSQLDLAGAQDSTQRQRQGHALPTSVLSALQTATATEPGAVLSRAQASYTSG